MALSKEWQSIQKEGRSLLVKGKGHLKKNMVDWDENKRLMMGYNKEKKNGIAEAYGIFRSIASSMLAQTPRPYFEAKKEEQRMIAAALGDAVYYDFDISNLRLRLMKALWQNFPYGFGYIVEDVETEHERSKKGEIIGIKNQFFTWRNVHPRDVIFDPDGFYTDFSDHRFQGIAYYKTIHELRTEVDNDGKPFYSNLDKVENLPKANEGTDPNMRGRTKNIADSFMSNVDEAITAEQDPNFYQIKLWRVYDRPNACIMDFADADHRLIGYHDWPMPVTIQNRLQFPGKMLAMNQESDGFYPPAELSLIKPQLQNMVRINDQLMTDLTVKLRAYIALSPYFDKERLGEILDLKIPNKVLFSNNVDVLQQQSNLPKVDDIKDAFSKLPDIQVDPQLFPGLQECRAQIQRIMNLPNTAGMPAPRSSKEAARLAAQQQAALMQRQTPLEETVSALALYHSQLLKYAAPYTKQRYFRMTDKLLGMNQWASYNPSEIPDETDLYCDVYIGSSTPQTLDTKKAEKMQMASTLLPYVEKLGLDPRPIIYELGQVFQWKYMDSFFQNQKGAAMEALAALVKAGQMGSQAPPEMLYLAFQKLIDSTLNAGEKQAVIKAMQQAGQAGAAGVAGPANDEQAGAPPGPIEPAQAAGNQTGIVS